MSAHRTGERLGSYELVSPIGAGGMGEVWKARDTRVDRIVAIKFAQPGVGERFEREGRAIAALNHPNGREMPVTLPVELRITDLSLAPTAVNSNQRMLVDVSSPLVWFYRPAVLDLRTGSLTTIPMSTTGDCVSPGWAADGSIFCQAVGFTGSLWRYRREGTLRQPE